MKPHFDWDSNLGTGAALPRFAAVRSPVRGASARMPTQSNVGGCGRLPASRVESVRTTYRSGGGAKKVPSISRKGATAEKRPPLKPFTIVCLHSPRPVTATIVSAVTMKR